MQRIVHDVCIHRPSLNNVKIFFVTFQPSNLPSESSMHFCSRHFAKDCYDHLLPMKHGVDSLRDVKGKRLLLPTAIPTLNLPKKRKSSNDDSENSRGKRMKLKEQKQVVEQAMVYV